VRDTRTDRQHFFPADPLTQTRVTFLTHWVALLAREYKKINSIHMQYRLTQWKCTTNTTSRVPAVTQIIYVLWSVQTVVTLTEGALLISLQSGVEKLLAYQRIESRILNLNSQHCAHMGKISIRLLPF